MLCLFLSLYPVPSNPLSQSVPKDCPILLQDFVWLSIVRAGTLPEWCLQIRHVLFQLLYGSWVGWLKNNLHNLYLGVGCWQLWIHLYGFLQPHWVSAGFIPQHSLFFLPNHSLLSFGYKYVVQLVQSSGIRQEPKIVCCIQFCCWLFHLTILV